ncbi:MAG TPA: rod shape-determining protein RodA [Verrucomicrobiae bacterium]|jgi:rod shape determining protein RodA
MFDPRLNEKKSDFDWPLHVATLGLALIGTAFIFSATARHTAQLAWYREDFVRQIIWYVVGLAAAVGFCTMEYGSITRWAAVYYWVAIIVLVAIFAVGTIHHGGKRWINLGAFSLQPSEFAKIAFILWLGSYLSRPQEELRMAKVFFACVGYTLLPFILILKEPDLGSALVFLAISLAMMFVAGVPKRMLAGLVGGLGLLAALVIVGILYLPAKFKIVESYQKDRVLTYFGRDKSKGGSSYNVEQALISVGSGGLAGKGWGQGTQHSLGFLPREGAHNDFIFSVIAEEEGFVGSVVVLTLYMVLLFSGIKIAGQARDRLGQLLAVGVVTLLFCHVFINIGMNIRIMPVTGIPLPLLSYGGSSVVCSLIAIGILHNVHIYRRSY